MKKSIALLALLAGLLLFLFARPSAAHELRPAALAVSEVTAGRFVVRLTPSANVGFEWAPEVRFPVSCRLEDALLDCQPEGLNGEISIASFPSAQSRVIARVKWLDGRELLAVLTSDAPSLGVRSERSEGADRARLVLDYTKLGVEHILTGVDHLLFVFGLLLLVRFGRRLVWTISAFTLAHSLTLSAAVLGLVTVPRAPVEAVIALSILLLSVECAKRRDSLARRLPWVVAFSFGLLHGFGFAGALREVGLPPAEAPLALLFFNVGVELGQLAVIAVAGAIVSIIGRRPKLRSRVEVVAVYAMGALAAFWSIERVLAVFAS
jgi:hydrogenase/urease accessory protein HupE